MMITADAPLMPMNRLSTPRIGIISVSIPANSCPSREPTVVSIRKVPLNLPLRSSGTYDWVEDMRIL